MYIKNKIWISIYWGKVSSHNSGTDSHGVSQSNSIILISGTNVYKVVIFNH